MTIWNLSSLRQAVRDTTGRKTASQMADAVVDGYINEYYTSTMPNDLDLEELQDFWTTDTTAGVDSVALDDDVLFLRPPFTIDGYPLEVVDDPAKFYSLYPKSGEPYDLARPTAALYLGRSLLLRPGPDEGYEIHAPAYLIPSALSGSGSPAMDHWGRLIVLGAALLIYGSFGQREEVAALSVPYESQRALVQRPYIRKMMDYRGQPRF